MAYTEEQGIKAIIELQLLAGIMEPEERAKAAWASFSDLDKKQTEAAHREFCGGFSEDDSPN
jgi:hypothetical protein